MSRFTNIQKSSFRGSPASIDNLSDGISNSRQKNINEMRSNLENFIRNQGRPTTPEGFASMIGLDGKKEFIERNLSLSSISDSFDEPETRKKRLAMSPRQLVSKDTLKLEKILKKKSALQKFANKLRRNKRNKVGIAPVDKESLSFLTARDADKQKPFVPLVSPRPLDRNRPI